MRSSAFCERGEMEHLKGSGWLRKNKIVKNIFLSNSISPDDPRCLSNDRFNDDPIFCGIFSNIKNRQRHRTGDENRRIS